LALLNVSPTARPSLCLRIPDKLLEDGTVLKVKGVATSVMRIDNQFLPDGNPIYIVYMNPVTSVQSSPLTKPPETPKPEEKAN
jgi:hypothetical protein